LEMNNKQNLISSININNNDWVTVGSDIKYLRDNQLF
jgi:hypothetical protein